VIGIVLAAAVSCGGGPEQTAKSDQPAAQPAAQQETPQEAPEATPPAEQPAQAKPEPAPEPEPAPQGEATANYLRDTVWESGKVGKLIAGLDRGSYEPYDFRVIEKAQTVLKAEGLYNGAVHGVLDQATMEAIGEFQTQNGIVRNGVPTRETRKALDAKSS
jgi:pyruvate/2-oxoglutarate dehydrogenase complex dihydrolipoamide acyltransferase (E2) component